MTRPHAESVVQSEKDAERWPEATVSRVSAVLGGALEDDPLMRFVFPDPKRRSRASTWLYGDTLRYGLRYGKVDLAEGGEGAAVWLPPDQPTMTLGRMLRVGFLLAPLRIGLRRLVRLGRYKGVKQRLRRSAVSGPHWYLLVIGVSPSTRGRGVGKALLQTTLDVADKRSDACYLETTRESNLAFFEKAGFVVQGEGGVPSSDVRVWGMVREPRG